MSEEITGTGRIADIDSFEREADELEQTAETAEVDLDLEASEADPADIAEQRIELLQHRDEPITARPSGRDDEADPADIADQRRVVELDEEDYR